MKIRVVFRGADAVSVTVISKRTSSRHLVWGDLTSFAMHGNLMLSSRLKPPVTSGWIPTS
jgi:hypothetical protein